jgi:hypothetical protein
MRISYLCYPTLRGSCNSQVLQSLMCSGLTITRLPSLIAEAPLFLSGRQSRSGVHMRKIVGAGPRHTDASTDAPIRITTGPDGALWFTKS